MKSKVTALLILLIMIISCGGNSPKRSLQNFLDSPRHNNYGKFLRHSLKAQMLMISADENGMTAEKYFDRWKNENGHVVKIKEYGPQRTYYFENQYETEAITYTVTYKLPGYDTKIDNEFQVLLISEEIKSDISWLEADAGEWVVMDNLFY